MRNEIPIDRDLRAVDLEWPRPLPFRLLVAGRLAGSALAQEHDVGDDGGAFPFEGVRRQPDRPDEIGFRAEIFADGGILFVQREMGRDHRQNASGLQGVDGLGEEVIVQRQLLPVVIELEVGERHVADDGVDAAFGQLGVAEILDADVLVGVQRLGDAAGDASPFRRR